MARNGSPNPLEGLPLLEDLPDPAGRHVLVRVDFNVPLERLRGENEPVHVADDFRIRASLPTIEWLMDHGAKVRVCTHLGRPKGMPNPLLTVEPVRVCLAKLAPGVEFDENLRFDPGEVANDPAFVDRLMMGVDLYVNDAFGVSHRKHASVVGPPARVPSAAGRLLAREVEVLGGLLDHPTSPFVAVIGGVKIADKLGVVRSLLTHADLVVVGGGMAFNFLAARGEAVGGSVLDEELIDDCREMLLWAGDRLVLPTDIVALSPDGEFGQGCTAGITKVVSHGIPDGWRGVDIGPESARMYADIIAKAKTVLWNGPMGVFEDDRFAHGTQKVAQAVADCRGLSVVGGGDSVAALDYMKLAHRVDFVSTGGGASLELLEYGDLPGLVALRHASNVPPQLEMLTPGMVRKKSPLLGINSLLGTASKSSVSPRE